MSRRLSLLCTGLRLVVFLFFFFFNDTATTEIYTLSLHDALPICTGHRRPAPAGHGHGTRPDRQARRMGGGLCRRRRQRDRKSTRLNSSHSQISYAVFCLKKKKKTKIAASDDKKTIVDALQVEALA